MLEAVETVASGTQRRLARRCCLRKSSAKCCVKKGHLYLSACETPKQAYGRKNVVAKRKIPDTVHQWIGCKPFLANKSTIGLEHQIQLAEDSARTEVHVPTPPANITHLSRRGSRLLAGAVPSSWLTTPCLSADVEQNSCWSGGDVEASVSVSAREARLAITRVRDMYFSRVDAQSSDTPEEAQAASGKGLVPF